MSTLYFTTEPREQKRLISDLLCDFVNSVRMSATVQVGFIKVSNGSSIVAANVFEHPLDLVADRNGSEDNHISVDAGRADVSLGHGGNGRAKLLDHRFGRSAALADIALEAPLEADVVGHIDVDSGAKMMTQFGPEQCEKALHDHEFRGMK